LLRAHSHGNEHSWSQPSGNEAESNQSVHFPFPYAGKLCELSKNERAAEPGAERAFRPYTDWMDASAVAFTIWTPHVPKCKHYCNDEDGHHPKRKNPDEEKRFLALVNIDQLENIRL